MIAKYKIGNSVKQISADQIMIIITVILSHDYSENIFPEKLCFNGKYKCAWLNGLEAFSAEFGEWELMFA